MKRFLAPDTRKRSPLQAKIGSKGLKSLRIVQDISYLCALLIDISQDMNHPHTLGTQPVGRLLLQYSLPAIIGMALNSLYHIIDSIFIGRGVGPMGIVGLAVTFPLMNLASAFCTLVSAGGGTIVSIRLGEKDLDGAMRVLGNTLLLCLACAVLFSVTASLWLDRLLFLFGVSPQTLPYARAFMEVILPGIPVNYVMIGLNNLMRSTGHPQKAMLTSVVTVLCNLVLAPLFIFGLEWGLRGAALATVLSQLVGMTWVLSHFLGRGGVLRLRADFWRSAHLPTMGSICAIGLSPFLMNACTCAVVILINLSLQRHGGDLAVGAYGIVNRLLVLFVITTMGLSMGMQPLVGYNLGARQADRVRSTLRLGLQAGVCITTTGFLLCEFFPEAVCRAFTADGELVRLAAHGLRISVMFFPLVGAQIVISNFFQSIGRPKSSIFLSLTRQLLYLLPCLLLLPALLGTDGVWWSLAAADLLAFLTAAGTLWGYFRK